jgi:hypothetical protein
VRNVNAQSVGTPFAMLPAAKSMTTISFLSNLVCRQRKID